MTKLVLHIGQPKTGTTSIQSALELNRAWLQDQGVLYPALHPDINQHSALAQHLTAGTGFPGTSVLLNRWPGTDPLQQSGALWDSVIAEVATHHPDTVLLSGEDFFSIRDASRLRHLSDILRATFSSVDVHVWLRSPAQIYLAQWQQRMKDSGQPAGLVPIWYAHILKSWIRHGPGPLHIHTYNRDQTRGADLITTFLAATLPDLPALPRLPKSREQNTTLSAEALAVLEARAQHIPPKLGLARRRETWRPIAQAAIRADLEVPGYKRPDMRGDMITRVARTCFGLAWLRDVRGVVFEDLDYTIAGTAPEPELGSRPGKPEICGLDEICTIDQIRQNQIERAIRDILGEADPGLWSGARARAFFRKFPPRFRRA